MDIISILTGLISFLLVWCIEHQRKKQNRFWETILRMGNGMMDIKVPQVDYSKIRGELQQAQIRASIAEKMSEKAFNMASAANLGVIALQRTLQVPRLMTKEQGVRNALAKKEVDKLFDTNGSYDFLRPILSDEDLDILDEIEKKKLQDALTNGEM